MKNLIASTSLLMFTFIAASKTLILEGKYQNKNLYVVNRISSIGVGFSVYEVLINGRTTNDEVNAHSFEIDLTHYNFKFGNDVIVEINYHDDVPKIINPDALKPQPMFEAVGITIDKNGLLRWAAKNEMLSIPFVIEQFRWNKWVKVGEVQGKGSTGTNEYLFQTILHSGENKFRVRQLGHNGRCKTTPSVIIVSSTIKPDYSITKNRRINFTDRTLFEIYDYYGSMVKRGYGTNADLTGLLKGGYFLCYDNTVAQIKKK